MNSQRAVEEARRALDDVVREATEVSQHVAQLEQAAPTGLNEKLQAETYTPRSPRSAAVTLPAEQLREVFKRAEGWTPEHDQLSRRSNELRAQETELIRIRDAAVLAEQVAGDHARAAAIAARALDEESPLRPRWTPAAGAPPPTPANNATAAADRTAADHPWRSGLESPYRCPSRRLFRRLGRWSRSTGSDTPWDDRRPGRPLVGRDGSAPGFRCRAGPVRRLVGVHGDPQAQPSPVNGELQPFDPTWKPRGERQLSAVVAHATESGHQPQPRSGQ